MQQARSDREHKCQRALVQAQAQEQAAKSPGLWPSTQGETASDSESEGRAGDNRVEILPRCTLQLLSDPRAALPAPHAEPGQALNGGLERRPGSSLQPAPGHERPRLLRAALTSHFTRVCSTPLRLDCAGVNCTTRLNNKCIKIIKRETHGYYLSSVCLAIPVISHIVLGGT